MIKKTCLTVSLIFVIIFGLNFFTPLCFGDDYVYAFIWPGQSMYVPLPDTAKTVSGLRDLLVSQWAHYFTWSGRTIAHLLVQFFVWHGKTVFNFANTLVFMLLIFEIYWISNKGAVSIKNCNPGALVWIFFMLWMFTVNFGGVYLWLTGSCNYLWMMVILLSFVLLYVRKYFQMETKLVKSGFGKYLTFLWGVVAGWTNENTVCWLILFLALWLYRNRNKKSLESWMWLGLSGLCAGYMLMIFAPGNALRASYYAEHSINLWEWGRIQQKLITFGLVEFFQVFLWFFIITSFKKIGPDATDSTIFRQIVLAKVFCAFSLLSNAVMLLSPEFPSRSGFFSLVFLLIAAALLLRVQDIVGTRFIDEYARKFLSILGIVCFAITLCTTYWGYYLTYEYDKKLIETVSHFKESGASYALEVPFPPEHSAKLVWASLQHLIHPELTENENHWMNVAFARYYGIQGIRMIKDKNKGKE